MLTSPSGVHAVVSADPASFLLPTVALKLLAVHVAEVLQVEQNLLHHGRKASGQFYWRLDCLFIHGVSMRIRESRVVCSNLETPVLVFNNGIHGDCLAHLMFIATKDVCWPVVLMVGAPSVGG